MDSPGTVETVELWTTLDEGATWSLAAVDGDARSPVDLRAPDGSYGLWIAAGMRPGGPGPRRPRPGDAPAGRALIDTVPPELRIGEARVAPRREGGATVVEVRVPVEVVDPNPDPASLRAESRVPGGRFRNVPLDPAALLEGEAAFTIPLPSSEPVAVRFTASDLAGNVSSRSEDIHPLDVLDPPRLELALEAPGPQGAGAAAVLKGGSAVRLRARVDWSRLERGGASISASPDGGRTWQTVASAIDARPGGPAALVPWTVPLWDGDAVLVELAARGACGYRASRRIGPLRVDSRPPAARILGPRVASPGTVRLVVEAKDLGPAGIDRLLLFERAPGESGPPRKAGEFPAGSPVELAVDRPGERQLWLAAVDRAGNATPAPRPPTSRPSFSESPGVGISPWSRSRAVGPSGAAPATTSSSAAARRSRTVRSRSSSPPPAPAGWSSAGRSRSAGACPCRSPR